MTLGPATTIVRQSSEHRSFVTRHIADETLIVPVTGNVMDLESIYVLNAVGSRIWDLLEEPTTADRIGAAVSEEFEVPPSQATADVMEFLAALESRGLIQAAAGAA